jgi:hypothetical protein
MQQTAQTPLPAARAEVLAITALGWLAAQDDLLAGFLAASGATLDDLRARAADPAFLGAVLDFLLTDDAFVLGFAADAQIAPDMVLRARAGLPGGDLPHWT